MSGDAEPRPGSERSAHSACEGLLAGLLEPLQGVLFAEVDAAGTLRRANAALQRLLAEGGVTDPANLGAWLLQPAVSGLLSGAGEAGAELYGGLLRIGRGEAGRLLPGRICRAGDGGWLLLAERDAAECGRLTRQLDALQDELSAAHAELAQRRRELALSEERVQQLLRTDELTGVANHRQFHERLELEVERSRRYGVSCSIALADIDHFSLLNERFGSSAGDRVLRQFAGRLVGRSRRCDLVARIGGEEFVVLMPETGVAEAALCVERIRVSLASEPLTSPQPPVHASFGVTPLRPVDAPADVIARADSALNRAKQAGRNRVEVAG